MPKAGERLSQDELAANFADLPRALTDREATIEAARCFYCFDAPCTRACPTHIDVPAFIRQILHRDALGAARTILEANILGGSCARACPTEVLCEGACVDRLLVDSPIQIGRLQRFACDTAREASARLFEPGQPTGKTVAIVGCGPAGLSCAHELRKRGHAVVIFEARDVPGGLNTLGIAAYKISTEFALSEVELVRQLGVEIRLNHHVDAARLKTLLTDYDAVFLAVGLGRTASLGIEGEDLPGVWEALDFIFQTHTRPFADCQVGRHVLVIGAGNTAIDVATAARRLGAERVTIAYRRGEESMPAFAYEYELAKADGVRFEWFAQPLRVLESAGMACGIEFVRTVSDESISRQGRLRTIEGSNFLIEADMIVKALGQEPLNELTEAFGGLNGQRRGVRVDPQTRATRIPKLFAGGDCLRSGGEIVDAVQDGKIAAWGIDAFLKK
jgi:glutamate synthase (NADPH/NADH) small chain